MDTFKCRHANTHAGTHAVIHARIHTQKQKNRQKKKHTEQNAPFWIWHFGRMEQFALICWFGWPCSAIIAVVVEWNPFALKWATLIDTEPRLQM